MNTTKRELLTSKIAANIAKRRKQLNMSQFELAEKLGVGLEAVSRIERGVTSLTIEKLAKIAELLGCGLSEMIEGCHEQPNDQFAYIKNAIVKLDSSDRAFLVAMIERFIELKNIKS